MPSGPVFEEQMALLAAYCRCELDDMQTKLYGAALHDLSDAQLARATVHVIQHFRFIKYGELIPVAALREAAEATETPDERARARRKRLIISALNHRFIAPDDAAERLRAIEEEERSSLVGAPAPALEPGHKEG